MELNDAAFIEILKKTWAQREPRVRGTKSADSRPVYQAPATKSFRRRCACGVCSQCLEDARWERIYREKFKDPDYYRQPFRRASSLHW